MKIVDLVQLKDVGGVLCHGCFDILHIGHVKMFQIARLLPSRPLIVTITADVFINKGPDRPVFKQQHRAEMLEALEIVDYVSIVHDPTSVLAIETIRPQFYVKGREYEHADDAATIMEQKLLKMIGGQIVYTDRYASSSELVGEL